MTRPVRRVALAGLVLSGLAYGYWMLGDRRPAEMTVFAGAGMSDALLEVAETFEKESGCRVRFSFAASSTLARQISAGAEPDVFISAHPKWMDFLEEKEAIQPATRHDLLGNRMVCIAPEASAVKAAAAVQWLHALDGRIAMGDPEHVPAGIYGAQALKSLGVWDDVCDRLAPAADTRAALRSVAMGECQGGIVYATDARASRNVVEVTQLAETLHEPIRFPAALCTHCGPQGERFFKYLESATAKAVFEKHGFTYFGAGLVAPSTAGISQTGLTAAERQALRLSLQVGSVSVFVLLMPGIMVGWLLARCQFPGKSLIETLTHLPLVVPPVVTGYVLLLLLGRNGYAGAALDRLFGIHLGFTLWAAVLASSVMAFPLMVRSVQLAIELVRGDLEEAAAMSGAGPAWRFLTVTLPLAGPGILAGVVLAFSRSLGEFGATITFAGNIPGETQTVPLAIYTALQRPGGDDAVLRLAVFSVLIAMGALWASRRLEVRMRRSGEHS